MSLFAVAGKEVLRVCAGPVPPRLDPHHHQPALQGWARVFPDALNAQVIAERLTERSERFVMDGKGYRPHALT